MSARISGRYLANTIDTIRAELGDDRFHFLASRCPPQTATLLQRVVRPDEWIESEVWYAVYDVMIREIFCGDHLPITAIARRSASRLLSPMQKRLLGLLPVHACLRLVSQRWIASMEGASFELRRLPSTQTRRQLELKLAGVPKQLSFAHAFRGYVEEVCCISSENAQVSVVDVESGRFRLIISY